MFWIPYFCNMFRCFLVCCSYVISTIVYLFCSRLALLIVEICLHDKYYLVILCECVNLADTPKCVENLGACMKWCNERVRVADHDCEKGAMCCVLV